MVVVSSLKRESTNILHIHARTVGDSFVGIVVKIPTSTKGGSTTKTSCCAPLADMIFTLNDPMASFKEMHGKIAMEEDGIIACWVQNNC
jgi:hypothetical protein